MDVTSYLLNPTLEITIRYQIDLVISWRLFLEANFLTSCSFKAESSSRVKGENRSVNKRI